jgi:ATP-binding protein involved in chromosome partitioning
MADGPLSADQVRGALADFQDPETGRSVVKMEQVGEVAVDGDRVAVSLGLTAFAAPLWGRLKDEAVEHLRAKLPGAGEIDVRIVEHDRPATPVGEVSLAAKAVIAVGSGKGGVGKSTIAATMAIGLARAGCKVGLLDADIYGPSIPLLLGSDEKPHMVNKKIEPVRVDGLKVMSIGFLVPAGEAVIWRGPMLHGALTQFLQDINWGDLDYLVIDMPPGTGDVPLSLGQLVPITGTVVVCTPQDVALADAAKAIAMYRKMDLDVLGMVENMSHFICTECQARHEIFGHGGAKAKAAELGVPFLGEVPLNVQLRIQGDEGRVAEVFEDAAVGPCVEELNRNLVETIVSRRKAEPPKPTLRVL